jgi:hypothetical protein
MRKVLVFGAAGLLLSAAVTGMAHAQPGNSLNARSCNKGGWANLVTVNGEPFASEQACTSYAARGGTLVSRRDYLQAQWAQKCAELNGTFSTSTSDGSYLWSCGNPPSGGFTPNAMSHLASICVSADGTFAADPAGTSCGFTV